MAIAALLNGPAKWTIQVQASMEAIGCPVISEYFQRKVHRKPRAMTPQMYIPGLMARKPGFLSCLHENDRDPQRSLQGFAQQLRIRTENRYI